MQEAVFSAVVRALEAGEDAALVTIVAATGSTPQRVGAKMLVFPDGRTIGTIGGGCYEHDAAGKARESLRTRRPRVATYELTSDIAEETGLICGGRMEVFIEPLDPAPRLYVVGAGHVSQHLARMAADVGFRVVVVDDRQQFASAERFPGASDVIVADIETYLRSTAIPASAFVVVVTRGHRHDLDALRVLAGQRLRYLGMIGSRAKVKKIADALVADGAPSDWLRTIHAPIGLRIGAITPEEIAVSIVAELVAVRRGAAENESSVGQPMRWDRLGR